jgi:TrmH family RNA methyltransferase
VKSWVALANRSDRDTTGLFLVEGEREADRIRQLTAITETIWCEKYTGREAPRRATTVSDHVFDRISKRSYPDGVAVIATTPYLGIDAFDPPTPSLVMVADGIEKPGNVGAIVRTVDGLGASFIGSDLGTDLVNPNVIRSAQGSLFAMATAVVDRDSAVHWCSTNTQVVVLRPDDDTDVWDIDFTTPTSIVVGAEHSGVGSAWDDVGIGARIPTVGMADSLNASVSAAIVLAEARRQRSV